jgi:DNA-binding MarR family transcriptional regulator
LSTVVDLAHAHAALVRRFDRALSAYHGVGFGDFVLLLELRQAPGGRLRRVDLADRVGLSPSGVTRALGPLERIGLVDREPHPRDARVAYASLSETGERVVDEVLRTAREVSERVFEAWSADELDSFARSVARLAERTPGP